MPVLKRGTNDPGSGGGGRAECVKFDNVRTDTTRTNADALLTPRATDPVGVEYRDGDPELISADRANSRFTIERGSYVFRLEGDVSFAGTYAALDFNLIDTSDDSIYQQIQVFQRLPEWQHLDRTVALVVDAATTLSLNSVDATSTYALRDMALHIHRL